MYSFAGVLCLFGFIVMSKKEVYNLNYLLEFRFERPNRISGCAVDRYNALDTVFSIC